jgi:hypothetical protein
MTFGLGSGTDRGMTPCVTDVKEGFNFRLNQPGCAPSPAPHGPSL